MPKPMTNQPITLPGAPLKFAEIEPAPQAVDGALLLDELAAEFRRFIALAPEAADALALWVVFTWTFQLFEECPRLAVTSPVKRCGKTRLLKLLEKLVRDSLRADNISSAAIYRTIEKHRPTLLIDEADTFLPRNDEMRGILNSGWSKGGLIMRCVSNGNDYGVGKFPTWCPVAISQIGRLADTLEDRSIEIRMKRKGANDATSRPSRSDFQRLEEYRPRILRWLMDNAAMLSNADPNLPELLHDRAADNWRPLVAIADVANNSWPDRARHAAICLSSVENQAENSIGEMLLSDIRSIFEERAVDRLSSGTLSEALGEMEGRPWADLTNGRPITTHQLARRLRAFSISPHTIRIGDQTPKGYYASDFGDAFARYLPPRTATLPQSRADSDFLQTDNRHENATDCNTQLPAEPVARGASVADALRWDS